MIGDLITNPDRFFRQRAEDVGLARPTVVVAILGVVGGLSGIPVVRATFQAMPDGAGAFAVLAYVFSIAGGVAVAFVSWVLYAGAFHVVSSLAFDGEGPFRRTLGVTGWGFVPGILAAALSAALAFYALQSVTIPSDPAAAQAFGEQFGRHPIVRLAGVLGIAFLLWQAFLWTFAVRHAREVTLREAAITVAMPVAVAILWRLYSLV